MNLHNRKAKILLGLSFVGLLILSYWMFCYKTPAQLAGDAQNIPRFFGLTESDFTEQTGEVIVLDELYSQGRKWEDFGSAHYSIRLCECHPNIRRELEEKGAIETDSTWVLTRIRGDIKGVFVLYHHSSRAYVHYNQIYKD